MLALDFYGRGITAAFASIDDKTDSLRIRKIIRKECVALADAFVLDLEGAKREVNELIGPLLSQAENPPSVIAGLRGHFLSFQHRHGFATVTARNHTVRDEDVEDALNDSVPSNLDESLEVLDILPLSYNLDGSDGIINPVGLSGIILDAETFVTFAQNSHLKNIKSVLAACGCEDAFILPTSVAIGESMLESAEQKGPTLVMDIGDKNTSALLYKKGCLLEGWEINKGLNVLISAAAQLLQNDDETTWQVLRANEPGEDPYTDELWEDASVALLQQLKSEFLQSFTYLNNPPTHILLSGQGVNEVLLHFTKQLFNCKKVKIPLYSRIISDCPTDLPAYNGALSLLFHTLERENNSAQPVQPEETGLLKGFFSKFGFGSFF